MKNTIVLVEDDKSLNRAVSLKLSKEGYDVRSAETVREAWDIYERCEACLIICDVGLPDGSGLDLCMKVRAGEKGVEFKGNDPGGRKKRRIEERAHISTGLEGKKKQNPVRIMEKNDIESMLIRRDVVKFQKVNK